MAGLLGLFDRIHNRMLTTRELDALCADLAISPGDIALFANSRPGVRSQMEAMAAQFGITGRDIDAERWRALEIVRACSTCKRVKDCKAFLAGRDSRFDPYDCPNAAHYATLGAETQ